MKSSLKNGKAGDCQDWSYEIIKNAGNDLDECTLVMMNCMVNKKMVPKEWRQMVIKPIDKGSGWLDMEKKRGLFMTNILSKCMEKILFNRRSTAIEYGMTNFQCGGVKGRST